MTETHPYQSYGYGRRDTKPVYRKIEITINDSKSKMTFATSIKATRYQFETEYEDLIMQAKEKLDLMLRRTLCIDN